MFGRTSRSRRRFLCGAAAGTLVGGCASVAPRPRSPAGSSQLSCEHFRLSNGLTVILNPDPQVALVNVTVIYQVGSKDDPVGREGLAHLVEHVMFRGGKHVSGEEFEGRILSCDGRMRGSTTLDLTTFRSTRPASELERALWLESERMGFLLEQPDWERSVALEREIVLLERLDRFDSNPGNALHDAILEPLFGAGHPYCHGPQGTLASLAGIVASDVRDFFLRHYGPENAVLAISGNFEPARAQSLLRRYFEPIQPARRSGIDREPWPDPPVGTTRVRLESARLPAGSLSAWRMPPVFSPEDLGVRLIGLILDAPQDGRLPKRLIESSRLARGATFHYEPHLRESVAGIFLVQGAEVSEEAVRAALDEELGRLRTELVTEAELARAKGRATMDILLEMQDLGARSTRMAQRLIATGDPNLHEELRGLDAITPERLRAIAGTYFGAPHVMGALSSVTGTSVEVRTIERVPPAGRRTSAPRAAAPAARPTPDADFRGRYPSPSSERAVDRRKVHRLSLANGRLVLIAENRATPMVSVGMVSTIGLLTSSPAESLRAQLSLNTLTRGTRRRTAEEIRRDLIATNSRRAGDLDMDSTRIFLHSHRQHTDRLLDLWDDLCFAPTFSKEPVLRAMEDVKGGNSEGLTEAETAFPLFRRSFLYGWAGEPSGLITEAFEQFPWASVGTFWQEVIRPEHAALVVAGDVDVGALRPRLDRLFARAAEARHAADTAPSPSPPPRPLQRPLVVLVPREGRDWVDVAVTARLPGTDHPDYTACSMAAHLLGGASAGQRLSREVRFRRAWAYNVVTTLEAGPSRGLWQAEARVRLDRALEVIRVIVREHRAMERVHPTEVAEAGRRLAAQALAGEEAVWDLAGRTALRLLRGRPAGIEHELSGLGAVDADAVQRVAARYLAPERLLLTVVGNEALASGLREFGEVQIWTPDPRRGTYGLKA
jgi:zinc protease